MKCLYKAGMYTHTHTHTQIIIVLQCQQCMYRVTLRSVLGYPSCFWICMVNVLAEPQVEEHSLLLILFCIWPPLQCDIHFHTQVAQDKVGEMAAYWLNVITFTIHCPRHAAWQHLFFVCVFWGGEEMRVGWEETGRTNRIKWNQRKCVHLHWFCYNDTDRPHSCLSTALV